MLQRAGLAQALVNDPELVFLDEPTSGLDPLGRLLVRDVIRDLRARGTTVFLNSHLLGEIEVTCDRVAFVKHGRVVHELSLIDAPSRLDVELRIDPAGPDVIHGLQTFGTGVIRENGLVRLQVEREESLPALARWLVERGVRLYGIQSRPKPLEQWFVDVMGEDQRPG
jgi:ABC-2 type transport system ATP-binding protein